MSFFNSKYFGNKSKGVISGNYNNKSIVSSRNRTLEDWDDLYIQDNSANLYLSSSNDGGNVGIGLVTPTEKLDISGNVKIRNNLYANIIDISQNLKVDIINEKTDSSGVTIEHVLLKDQNVTAHTISAQNYRVGNVNFVSASRQGNFRDLELKDSNNNVTLLAFGDSGNISTEGEINVDIINEKTDSSGVTIEHVLLKDQNVTAHTVSAQNYRVGNVNFVSASRQGNFRDLEIKSGSNQVTFLADGDSGDLTLNGTLSVDTINKHLDPSGITVEGVNLSNGSITAGSNSTISATNFNVGSKNVISAARQATLRDLELKDSNNNVTLLAFGDSGNVSMEGTLEVDTINEKTNTSGVTIENILFKGGDISGNDASFNNVQTNTIILNNIDLSTTLSNKQSTINDGDLSIAKTNGLQAALDLKAPINNPIFSGTPKLNTKELATQEYVTTQIDNLVNGAPDALNTLYELAAAIGDDNNYAAGVTNTITNLSNRVDASLNDLSVNYIKVNRDNIEVLQSEKQNNINNTTDISLKNLNVYGDLCGNDVSFNQLEFNSGIMNGNIIPSATEQYDLGSAEYKIRHLFLSDNSLWVGDDHKVSIRNGKMEFRKRNKSKVPKNLEQHASFNLNNAKHSRGRSNIEDFTLNDWKSYARDIGMSMSSVNDLFDMEEDFEDNEETVIVNENYKSLEERVISVTVDSKTSNHPRIGKGSTNSYFFNGIEAPILELVPGITYKFDLSHSSVNIHPIRFQTQETSNSNYEYIDGVVKHNLDNTGQGSNNVESYIKITVTENTPRKLYYVCKHHNYMGNSIYVSASNNFSGIDSTFNTIDVSNVILRGDIVPDRANVYSLGSPTHPLKELYLSGNSLYVDGTKLVETQDQTINIYGDSGQHVNLGSKGTGTLQLTSENVLQVITTGDGDIEINCQGSGTIELQSNVEVTGNIVPNSDENYSLGNSTNKFTDIYVKNLRFTGKIYEGDSEFEAGINIDKTTDISLNNLDVFGDISGVNSDVSFNNLSVNQIKTSGIMPSISNEINSAIDENIGVDIGDSSNAFRKAYIQELFVSSNSISLGSNLKMQVGSNGNMETEREIDGVPTVKKVIEAGPTGIDPEDMPFTGLSFKGNFNPTNVNENTNAQELNTLYTSMNDISNGHYVVCHRNVKIGNPDPAYPEQVYIKGKDISSGDILIIVEKTEGNDDGKWILVNFRLPNTFNVEHLTDVYLNNKKDLDLLKWNNTTNKWNNSTIENIINNKSITLDSLNTSTILVNNINVESSLNTKAPINNPVFTGTPKLNTKKIATENYVASEVDSRISSMPGMLDTLRDLSNALSNSNDVTAIINSISDLSTNYVGVNQTNIEINQNSISNLQTSKQDKIINSSDISLNNIWIYGDISNSNLNNTLDGKQNNLSVIGSVDGSQEHSVRTGITSITFDKNAGFTVSQVDSSNVTVGLGSHWKTLEAVADGGTIEGSASITPSGEEDLKIIAGNNIKLTLDNTANDQKLKIETITSGGGGGGGSGVTIVPSDVDLSENILYPTSGSGSGKEGDIIYDANKNKFYGAVNSKQDDLSGNTPNGEVVFRPLGYSFFAENLEGQPPSVGSDLFFFFLTSKSIVIKWTNPTQYHTGLTGPKGNNMPLDKTSPIVTAPSAETGGQIWFPIVNRIMIQIKNLDDNAYQTWGENISSISNTVFPNGRVICEKANIIPPASTSANSNNYFGPTYNYGVTSSRDDDDRVYKLQDFANSIILYKDKSIPDNLEGTDSSKSDLVDKRVYSAKQNLDSENEKYTLPDSKNGFEIKIWLENEYNNGNMQVSDFNIMTLTKMTRIMDESGNEVTSSSINSLKNQIGKPIRFLSVESPTKIRVADYGSVDGFHVKLKRINNTTIHYLECIIPKNAVNSPTLTNEDGIKVESTQSSGQENEVYFKGYFIEFQTIEADTNANKTLTELADVFDVSGTDWQFINFETFSSNNISFSKSQPNDTDESINMATDTESDLGTVIYPDGTTNPNNYGFISAAPYSGGFSTKTNDIDWSVSKAFRLNQGDNKFYRFRIRGLNSGNKNVGPVSEKYFYFRFNEPDQITWNTPIPKFKANKLSWDITLNWNSIENSSKQDTDDNFYTVSDLSIMEYKLQRRDSDSGSWQTISYWKNTATNTQLITHNYRIWPTPLQTIDSDYNSNSQTDSWSTSNNSNKAEWVYYESEGTKYYTQEARLLETDTNSPYKYRNPTFEFRIQARNYLFGKRVDTANSNTLETSIKQWFIEGTPDSTNNDKNITDTRWSVHSESSTGLATTAHTSTYTPLLQDNEEDKYEIKFYEKDSADSKSPWKNVNGNTDYDTTTTRRVKYTNNSSSSRTTNNNKPYNNIPNNDYISYQWKITDESNKTTVDSTTGLSIDRYEIIETYSIGASIDNSSNTESTPTTIIYSPDFTRGPANWHIREYNQFISSSPSFKFKVRAFNFFNSTSSNYSSDSTVLTPTKPSPPRYLSTNSSNSKEHSNPTFALTDNGITILVDEPQFTGQTDASSNYYQDQSISIKEFELQDIRLDSSDAAPTDEITLINSHGTTSRSGSNIQGAKSQVATFYHPNGYINNPNTALKDLTTGKVDYTFHAKNVLKDEFSVTSSCTLTIDKPNPGENFKYCPKFTWVSSTNKVKLEFFRKYSNTDILYDDSSINTTNNSTVAPLSDVTNNCNFSNTIKKLAWEVQCLASLVWTQTETIPNQFTTNTDFTTTGDDSNTIPAYSISDIYIEEQSYETTYTIDYRIRNQYNQNYFASTGLSDNSPLQIKLTEPNTVTNITSKFRYALSTALSTDSNKNNNLTINWKKPSEHGLQYKHLGGTSLSAQTQPNIKTYHVYFKDSEGVYYKFTRTASTNNYPTVADDVIIQSGWGSSNGLTVYSDYAYSTAVANGTIRLKPETTYTVEKITAINWLYDKESAAQDNTTASTYYNGINTGTTNVLDGADGAQYPPIIGSTQIISTNAPTPKVFNNYNNSGKLIDGSNDNRTVKILGDKDYGLDLTNVLLNAAYVKGKSSTMGIKIEVTDITDSNSISYSSECKFDSDKIVLGDSLTLTYGEQGLAEINVGTYSDLYSGSTSSDDNTNYWFKNASIKLKWLSGASDISSFYGKNLKFSTVVTYYAANSDNNIVVTRDIETGYYDKTIGNPSDLSITPSYTPFTCLGLPILHSSDTLTVSTSFNNKSSHWVASTNINTITLGTDVASKTTSKGDHGYGSLPNVSLSATDMGVYSGSSLKKDAQITVVAKNCKGTISETHSNKYIYDPNTLALINTINSQKITDSNLEVDTGPNASDFSGDIPSNKENFTVLKVPENFNPSELFTDKFSAEKIDLTENLWDLNNNNKRSVMIYDGKFCSEKYFRDQFGTSSDNYHSNVQNIINVLPASTSTTLQSYIGTGNVSTDNLKNDYRWGIFQYQIENIATDSNYPNAYPLYIQFKLGTDNNIVVGDLYNSGSKLSKVEIWSKLRSGTNETRWNKLVHSDKSYRQDETNYSSRVIYPYNTEFTATKQPSSSWYLPTKNNFDSWTSSNSNKLIKIRIGRSQNAMNILKTAAKANGDDTNKIQLFLAIGLHNSYSKYIGIPQANINMV